MRPKRMISSATRYTIHIRAIHVVYQCHHSIDESAGGAYGCTEHGVDFCHKCLGFAGDKKKEDKEEDTAMIPAEKVHPTRKAGDDGDFTKRLDKVCHKCPSLLYP